MEIGGNNKQQLESVIGRIERLEADKGQIAEDIREVYSEAKSNGFDVKALRAIVRRRAADKDKLAEFEAILDTYMTALGMT